MNDQLKQRLELALEHLIEAGNIMLWAEIPEGKDRDNYIWARNTIIAAEMRVKDALAVLCK